MLLYLGIAFLGALVYAFLLHAALRIAQAGGDDPPADDTRQTSR